MAFPPRPKSGPKAKPKFSGKPRPVSATLALSIADGRAITTGHNGKDTDTVYCFDAASGKELWTHSYPHPLDDLYYPGGTTGTPTIDGEVVYHVARRGQIVLPGGEPAARSVGVAT